MKVQLLKTRVNFNFISNLFVVIVVFLFSTFTSAQFVELDLSQNAESINFQASGQSQWDYKLNQKKINDDVVYELITPQLSKDAIAKLNQFKSPFLKKILVQEQIIDGKSSIQFFAASQDLEAFDYLVDAPSRLIIDFYFDPLKKNTSKVTKKEDSKKLKNQNPSEDKQTVTERKPAMTDVLLVADSGSLKEFGSRGAGLFDGGDPDYKRFSVEDHEISESSIIKSKQNFYLSFPMLQYPILAWKLIQKNDPVYEIKSMDTEENKRARLLITLFKNKRHNVFLKTADWFSKNYPDSDYKEIIQFMTADVLLELYKKSNDPTYYDFAIQKYIQTMNEFPKSDLNERTSLKIGFLALERGDLLNAMKYFENHIQRKDLKNRPSIEIARLGLAEAYLRINKYDEALQQYATIESLSPYEDYKIEANYRRGDIIYKKGDIQEAVKTYQASLKKYPSAKNLFPNVSFNLAEGLFSEKKYKDSLQSFADYLKRFPDTEEAPYALTRVGELLEILGSDPAKAMGAWMETYFRYGESPRAIVARLRTLSTRMKSMEEKELAEAVKSINDLAKKSDLKNIDQFATVMISDGYFKRGDYTQALDLLQKYHKANPSLVENKHIIQRIQSNIHNLMADQFKKGEHLKALRTHKKYYEDWMKKANRWDDIFVLGQIYEKLGSFKDSYNQYKKLYDNISTANDPLVIKEKRVQENIPEINPLLLRMSQTLSQQKRYNESFETLKLLKNPEILSENEQIERVQLAMKLYKQRGDQKTALRFVNEIINEWSGSPELLAQPLLQKASIEVEQGNDFEAIKSLEKLSKLDENAKKLDEMTHALGLEKLSELQIKNNQTENAVTTLNKLLKNYEGVKPLNSFRYKLGELHFKKGEIQKAAEVWSQFKHNKSTFWSNLAQEQLKNANWREDYNKYIKRIPAMTKSAEGVSSNSNETDNLEDNKTKTSE